MMRRVAMQLKGTVQGVNLRHLIRLQALQHHLVGWALNEPGGIVRLEVEGERQSLQQLYDWLLQSPGKSAITNIDMTWLAPLHNETAFILIG
jgi:acylphosphatase